MQVVEDNLIIEHDAGFFSCCSVKLDNIVSFFNTYKRLPKSIDATSQFWGYKTTHTDVTSIFFKTLDGDIPYVRDVRACHEYQVHDYKTLDFEGVAPFIKKYFSPSDRVMEKIAFFNDTYKIDFENTVSIYYRGLDKIRETRIGSYEDFLRKADTIKDKKFFIQTDTREFRDIFSSTFKNSFYFEELPTVNDDRSKVIHHCIDPSQREELGINILAVSNIISKTNSILTHSGNCGIWAVYYRGNNNGVYQYLRNFNDYDDTKSYWLA